jgi:hypothetical protein
MFVCVLVWPSLPLLYHVPPALCLLSQTSESLPHTKTWPLLIDSARSGRLQQRHHEGGWHGLREDAQLNSTVFACGKSLLPGDKCADACFWTSPALMDRVLEIWDATATAWLDSNLCWQQWRGATTHHQPLSDGIAACGPPTNCSHKYGCLVEPILAQAIKYAGAERSLSSAVRMSPSQTVFSA